jgi:hypothetical protein
MRCAEEKKFVGLNIKKKTSPVGVSSIVDPDPFVFFASQIRILPSTSKKVRKTLISAIL